MLPRTAGCPALHHRYASPGSTLPTFTSQAQGCDIGWSCLGGRPVINERITIHPISMKIRGRPLPGIEGRLLSLVRSEWKRGRRAQSEIVADTVLCPYLLRKAICLRPFA